MDTIQLNFHHDQSLAQIILNDGKGNVLNHLMMEELQLVLQEFQQQPRLKLITIEGAGKHFSFGASVDEHQKDLASAMLRNFHQLFFTLMQLSVPTVAKVSGQCLGGGMELAIMCNFIFADKTARFGQPEMLLGVFAPPASVILPEKIGLARAEELLITGKTIDASTACEVGLVNEIYDDKASMDAGTEAWFKTNILPKSASSLRFGVKAARVKFNHVLSNFLPQLESMYIHQLMNTHDANEGILSFMEKRNPVWENQ